MKKKYIIISYKKQLFFSVYISETIKTNINGTNKIKTSSANILTINYPASLKNILYYGSKIA